MKTHYETPDALRHDAHALAEDAKALIEATSDMADEKITRARQRLETALASGRDFAFRVEQRAVDGAQAADEYVRRHPYPSLLVAFGVGAVVGCLALRRGRNGA
jgi:ElaB/YqjD/DUF883 family membrane-anchored ribosome-binding protein